MLGLEIVESNKKKDATIIDKATRVRVREYLESIGTTRLWNEKSATVTPNNNSQALVGSI